MVGGAFFTMVINKGSRILQVVYMRNSVAGCRSRKLGLHTEKEGLLGRLSSWEGLLGRLREGLCPRSPGRSAANPVSCFLLLGVLATD